MLFDDTLIFTFIYADKGFVFQHPVTDGFPYDFLFDNLVKVVNIVENFDKIIKEDIVWKPLRNRVVKYEPFVNIDKGKYKSIIKQQYV